MSGWFRTGQDRQRARMNGGWDPEDMGFKAIAMDPAATISGIALGAGQITLIRIRLPRAVRITGVVVPVQTGGATLTSGQNLSGLYSTAGAKLAETASQHTAWTTTGWKAAAFTAGLDLAAGDYFIPLLFNGSTSPQFSRPNNVITGNGVKTTPLSALRSVRTIGGGRTALPSTLDFATEIELNGNLVPVALY